MAGDVAPCDGKEGFEHRSALVFLNIRKFSFVKILLSYLVASFLLVNVIPPPIAYQVY
jgi:hypothetical protein